MFIGDVESLNCLVQVDHVLWLGRRRSAWLSFTGGRFVGKNILFEEGLANKFF